MKLGKREYTERLQKLIKDAENLTNYALKINIAMPAKSLTEDVIR